jgi:hypothetical protein
MQPAIVICLPMASDFFMEPSPVIAVSPNNETEHATVEVTIEVARSFNKGTRDLNLARFR